MSDWEKELEGQEFYELCQDYRHCPVVEQDLVVKRFEKLKKFISSLLTKERKKMAKALRKEIIEWKDNQKADTSFKYEILMAEAGGIGNAVNFILKAIDCYLKK